MQHENQNKKKEWILRLESVEQPLANAGTAWERLHARLGEKKKNNATAWYWAAAVIAIIIAGTVFMPAAKKEEQVVVKQVENKPQPPVAVGQAPAVGQQVIATKSINKRKPKTKAPIVKVEEQVVVATSPSTIITPVADTLAVIATAPAPAPQKKKMRVVHINQLDNYVEQKATRNYFTANGKDGLIKIKLSPAN